MQYTNMRNSLHRKHVGEVQLPSVHCALLHEWSGDPEETVHPAPWATVPPAVQLGPDADAPLGSTRSLKAQLEGTRMWSPSIGEVTSIGEVSTPSTVAAISPPACAHVRSSDEFHQC